MQQACPQVQEFGKIIVKTFEKLLKMMIKGIMKWTEY